MLAVAKEEAKAKLRNTYTLGGLLFANLISWLPLSIVNLIARDAELVPDPVHTVATLFFMMQVATHPIVEIILLKDLREPFKTMICYWCGKKSPSNVSSMLVV